MRAAPLLVVACLLGCAHEQKPPPPSTSPALSQSEVTRVIPDKVVDRAGWADDIVTAIRLTKKEPTAERVCAVVAVIEQESGFVADPIVKDLPGIVTRGLREKLEPLGPLAGAAADAILDDTAPGDTKTFRARIATLKTERDLDRLFRDVARRYKGDMPGTFVVGQAMSAVLGKGTIEDLNPVTTAGSMQVKVSFARDLQKNGGSGKGLDDDDVRELLYTRGGGVRFGTARLIGYPAAYDDIRFRFADYNAGQYTSRNAAFQTMLAELTGRALVPDGDLLAWDDDGDVKDIDTNTLQALLAFGEGHDLSGWTVRRDAKKEKTEAFEQTATWKAVRAAWSQKTGKPAPYARIPDVALSSPKLSKPRTTAWFADNVKRRYDTCRAKLAPAPRATPRS